LKIDKLFVHSLGTDSATCDVTEHIIQMAQRLKLVTVAEGVESGEQAEILRGLGVEKGQGWLYGLPMPMDDLLQRLRAERTRARSPEPVS
ncbi:MAG: hypothetical protein JWR77_1530, partial [Rhizorhabdus sp.]|nr:hypothetical protein [Rhizorhabdus sp.]